MFDRVGGTLGELIKNSDISSLDVSILPTDDARFLEDLCYLLGLCVNLFMKSAKSERKKEALLLEQLSIFQSSFEKAPSVCFLFINS